MKIDRLDLDGLGSPAALAARIHELEPEMSARVPVEELCRCMDITSISELETEGFEAAIVMDELKAAGAILVAKNRPPPRRRYSIAHELGHFLIPSHRPVQGLSFECSLDDFHLLDPKERDRRKRVEAQANRFAANLLMPPDRLRARMQQAEPCLEDIVAIAQEFGVSKEAMARAWVDANRNPVAIIVLHRGRVERLYRHEDFPWIEDQNRRVPIGSIAGAGTPHAGEYTAVEEIEPDVWLSERSATRVLSLTEQVLGQSSQYALVLLQAELDDEE